MEFIRSSETRTYPKWPLLYAAANEGVLAFVDYAFAEMLLRNYPQADEKAAAFLCHLSFAARLGHLCLKFKNGIITPSPEELWFARSQGTASKELQDLLSTVNEGLQMLPNNILSTVSQDFAPATPVCRFENLIYLQKNWLYESHFIKNLRKLLSASPSIVPDLSLANELTKQMGHDGEITSQQACAILHSIENNLTIVCGGPGSGKTYTAAQFIKVFWQSLSQKQKENFEIAVAAPTGKAASNLYSSLLKALQGMSLLESIQPKTLHSLLGIKRKVSLNFLSADLILVDEASMIDAKLMAQLISSVKAGARLILLGDQHQLPSVEAGSLFADMISLFRDDEVLTKHWVELTTCLRTEIKSIVSLAEMINEGDAHQALAFLEKGNENQNVKRLVFEKGSNRKTRELLLDYAWPLFPDPLFGSEDPHHVLEKFNRFRILTPLRKGWLGVEELNQLLFQRACNTVKQNDCIAIPIVISNNDYQVNLFNGEGGLLIQRKASWSHEHLQDGDYALFPEGGAKRGFRKIPALLLPKFEYAYCLSVHKSQGSEFERVLLLLPEGAETLGREMLYTAITRAKKIIEIWGSDETFIKTTQRNTCRYSGIGHRMAIR